MNVLWHQNAVADLAKICEYIALDKPTAADSVYSDVLVRVQSLALFPEMGRVVRAHGFRELILAPYPYTMSYTHTKTEVLIVRVSHDSRKEHFS